MNTENKLLILCEERADKKIEGRYHLTTAAAIIIFATITVAAWKYWHLDVTRTWSIAVMAICAVLLVRRMYNAFFRTEGTKISLQIGCLVQYEELEGRKLTPEEERLKDQAQSVLMEKLDMNIKRLFPI